MIALRSLFLLLCFSLSASGFSDISQRVKAKYKKGQILVQRRADVSLKSFEKKHFAIGAYVVTRYDMPQGLELVQLPRSISVDDAVKYYAQDGQVAFAEPNYIYHALDAPNDTEFPKQWALNNTGLNDGVAHADINAIEGWNIIKGSEEFVLGIIDTGVLYTHPDLAENMWSNPGEIPANQIDDDNNGYIDDVHGINAITKKGDPLDDQGHGTHVAGIIGARANNAMGISGVNQRASIAACKFLDSRGGGSASDAITCLNYFAALRDRAEKPVKIIVTNNSWGGGPFSQALFDAIKVHQQKGILFVAAAANDSRNNDVADVYPANYGLSNIISVAATDNKDGLAYFSNFGSSSVHVAAPGHKILSTFLDNKYKELSGTSMAAPHVTGLVGLVQAQNPTMDVSGVRNLVIAGGKKITSVDGKTISGRRIQLSGTDGVGALTCQNQEVSKRLAPKNRAMTVPVGTPVDFRYLNFNCDVPAGMPIVASEQGLTWTDDRGVYTSQFMPTQSGAFAFDFGAGDVVTVNVYNPTLWRAYVASVDATFQYRVIAGTKLTMGDDTVDSIQLPFPIHFAGDDVGLWTLHVGSNGLMSLTERDVTSWQNTALPYTRVQTLVAPFWDDLNPSRGGGVYWEVVGTAPNRELVVEYRDVMQFSSGSNGTFQVVFFENSSDILFNYLSVEKLGNGGLATIGVQLSDKEATLFSHNEAKLTNDMAVRFTRKP